MNKKAQESVDNLWVKVFLTLLYALCFLFILYFGGQIIGMLQSDDPDVIALRTITGELDQAQYIMKKSSSDYSSAVPYVIDFPLSLDDDKYILFEGTKQPYKLCLYQYSSLLSGRKDKKISCITLDSNIRSVKMSSYPTAYELGAVPESMRDRVLIHPIHVILNYRMYVTPNTAGSYDVKIEFADFINQ
ncbi:MAG TPA: hypothetical protein VK158_01900 [Acidobacteriota bacterium]|nr:hypothetical protein [Acidobacteriota bacterium]